MTFSGSHLSFGWPVGENVPECLLSSRTNASGGRFSRTSPFCGLRTCTPMSMLMHIYLVWAFPVHALMDVETQVSPETFCMTFLKNSRKTLHVSRRRNAKDYLSVIPSSLPPHYFFMGARSPTSITLASLCSPAMIRLCLLSLFSFKVA